MCGFCLKGDLGMYSMYDYEVWKQRVQEMRREAETNWLARASRGWRPSLLAALWWELRRDAGRLHKWLRGGGG